MVVLLIGAAVAIALGGLLSVGATLRQRSGESAATLTTISRLEALRNVISDSAGRAREIVFSEIGTDHFTLSAKDPSPPLPLEVSIVHDPEGTTAVQLAYAGGKQLTSVDLSMFYTAQIEFLHATGGTMEWNADPGATDALAARIRVTQGDLEWNVPLWVVPRAPLA